MSKKLVLNGWWSTAGGKAFQIGLLLLILLIPSALVRNVIEERRGYQAEAEREYRGSWGPEQSVMGPVLVVPFATPQSNARGYLHIMPSRLDTKVELVPEQRRRGLFHATVYDAKIAFSGQFLVPPSALAAVPAEAELLWPEAIVTLQATRFSEVDPDEPLSWADQTLSFDDRAEDGSTACGALRRIAAHAVMASAPASDRPIPFETTLTLRGTQSLKLLSEARKGMVKASSSWSSPGFSGWQLPDAYTITDAGFDASWTIGSTGALSWIISPATRATACTAEDKPNIMQGRIGIDLLQPMPVYHMAERSLKYAILFPVLAFLTYFLFEMLAGLRIHIVQYGLLGLSLSLFGLLLISLAEPLGFTPSYVLASIAVLLQSSLYTVSVTGRLRLASLFAGILASLFGFLYIVLSLETYSLLSGSVALFALLSLVMAVTRRVRWSGDAPAGGSV